MRLLAIAEESLPNYGQPILGAESKEFYVTPATHFIATVEDLSDMLDYTSEDIDGMDDDAEEEPLPHMMCTWWTYPNRMTAMMGRVSSRTSLLRHHQSIDVSDTARNCVAKKIVIPAP